MMPFTEIHVGDMYCDPFFGLNSCIFIVVEKNEKEKMIKIQTQTSILSKKVEDIGKPFWKKNTDMMFSENWRVFSSRNI